LKRSQSFGVFLSDFSESFELIDAKLNKLEEKASTLNFVFKTIC